MDTTSDKGKLAKKRIKKAGINISNMETNSVKIEGSVKKPSLSLTGL